MKGLLEIYSELLQGSHALLPAEEAQFLANVGALRRRLGDPIKALATYRAAQALYKQSGQRDAEIAVLNNLGIVKATGLHDSWGRPRTFSEALKEAEASGNRPLSIQARLYRGEALYRLKNMKGAREDYEIAARFAKELGESEEEWKALYGLARVTVGRRRTAGRKGSAAARHRVDLIASSRPGRAGFALGFSGRQERCL